MSLSEFKTEQIRKVLRTLVATCLFVSKDDSIKELAMFMFCDQTFSVPLIIQIAFFISLLESIQENTETSFVHMTTPTIFESIILAYHSILFANGLWKDILVVPQNFVRYPGRLWSATHSQDDEGTD